MHARKISITQRVPDYAMKTALPSKLITVIKFIDWNDGFIRQSVRIMPKYKALLEN